MAYEFKNSDLEEINDSIISGGGGGGVSFGSDGQIPFTNPTGTGFDYSSGMVWKSEGIVLDTNLSYRGKFGGTDYNILSLIDTGNVRINTPANIVIGYNNTIQAFFKFNGNFSIGNGTDSSARIHIKGASYTNSTTAFLVENLLGDEFLKIGDGGNITMANLAVSNTGLSSGDIYADTAANILSNGDLVLGIKV